MPANKTSRSGWVFGGKKARMISARMKALKDPAAVKALLDGKRPDHYPSSRIAGNEED